MPHLPSPNAGKPAAAPTPCILVCEALDDIPERGVKRGDRIVLDPKDDSASLIRHVDRDTSRALLIHPSVSVVPLLSQPARRPRRFGVRPSLRLQP